MDIFGYSCFADHSSTISVRISITIDQETTVPIYNWIENLNPGDIVFADVSYSGSSAGELGPPSTRRGLGIACSRASRLYGLLSGILEPSSGTSFV